MRQNPSRGVGESGASGARVHARAERVSPSKNGSVTIPPLLSEVATASVRGENIRSVTPR